MFGHQHSHNGGDHEHSHGGNEMNHAMQRAFMNMRMNNNTGMPNFPPNMPPHMVEKAQEFFRNMQNRDPQQLLGPALPIPLQFHNASAASNVVDTQASATMNNAIINEDYSKCDIVKG